MFGIKGKEIVWKKRKDIEKGKEYEKGSRQKDAEREMGWRKGRDQRKR